MRSTRRVANARALGALAARDAHTPDANDVWKGLSHEAGAFLYNEWGVERSHYRKHRCVPREPNVTT